MKYVLFILAVFSLTISPAMGAETCMNDMGAQVMGAQVMGAQVMGAQMTGSVSPAQAGDQNLADADCCDTSDQRKGAMPDDCASPCALGCAGFIPGFATPPEKDRYQTISMAHFPPANGALLAMSIAFEPPPPRI